MPGLTRATGVAALAATLFASGCAATFGGYDVAPNGLTQPEAELRHGLAADPVQTHESVVDGERTLPDDDLLRLLYAGVTGRHADRFTESSQYLDVAGYVAEDRVTASVSRQALSVITSDRALAYTPGRTERLMIPYTAALNYLDAGDVDEAAVEARRIEALLDRYADASDGTTPPDPRLLHYFAATIFDAAGDANAASVAYRRAGVAGTGAEVDSMGDVVVLVERGFVPHRVEQSVVIALPPFQMEALTEGSAMEKAAAAAEATARILAAAAGVHGRRGPYYTDHRYRRTIHLSPWRGCYDRPRPTYCRGFDAGDGDPYLLRISWPVLYQDARSRGPVRVEADGAVVTATHGLDVGAGVRRDFEADQAAMLTRTVFRAATKMALSASAENAVSERDETAGRLVGLLVNLGTLLTERADTRSWHLLPDAVELVRLRLPAGTHRLALDADGWRGRDIDLGTVEVRPGRTAFVTHRIWR